VSIRETKPGVWDVRVYLGIDKGAPKFDYVRVYGNKQDAREAECKLGSAKSKQSAITAKDLTVSDFFVAWMEDYVRPSRSENTVKNYEYHIKSITPFIGDIRLRKLAPADIQRAYTQLSKTTSGSTIRGAHRVLHVALERAKKIGMITDNPADAAEQPKPSKFHPVVLTPEEAEKLLNTAKGRQHYALIATALHTGMRISELADVLWQDVDFAAQTIEVCQSKTPAGHRMVFLPPAIVKVLFDLHAKRKPEKTDHVFIGRTGSPICVDSISKDIMKALCKKAGLPRMRFHDLRHTHATWLAAADVSARTVADRLGHTDPSFTLRTYVHRSIEAQRRAVTVIPDIIKLPEEPKELNGSSWLYSSKDG